MKVFIFGAGASKGSQVGVNVDLFQAPVTDELFNEKYQTYADQVHMQRDDWNFFKNVIADSKNYPGTLEEKLSLLWLEFSQITDQDAKNANFAKFGSLLFYISWLFQRISESYDEKNLYKVLLEKILKAREPRGFISFNYDTLFDRALEKIYRVSLTNDINKYIDAKLIKPHGSVNWLFPLRSVDEHLAEGHQLSEAQRYHHAAAVYYSHGFRLTDLKVFSPEHQTITSATSRMNANVFSGLYSFPCVIPPLHTKDFSHIDQFKERIIQPGIEILHSASEIYLVGYQASDKIIEDMFKESKPDALLHIVSNKARPDIQEKVLAWSPTTLKTGRVYSKGFEGFVAGY